MSSSTQKPEPGLVIKAIVDTIPKEHHGSVYYALGGIVCDNPMETHVQVTGLLMELGQNVSAKPIREQIIEEVEQ